MKSSRPSSRPLVTLAGLALAAYGWSLWRRDPHFFEGKVVVITGGSRGLGLVIARRLQAEGATLAILARDADELEHARRELGGETLTLPCDLAQPAEIKAAIAVVAQRFGRIDAVFNVAGMIQAGPLQNMLPRDFEAEMQLHFWGSFHVVWETLPFLRLQRGARIVNVASIGGKIAIPHLAPYSASKFSLVGLSNALGIELAREGIRVTTVAPGLLRTGSHVNAKFKGQHAREFDWFSTSDNVPGVSVSAEYAARRIVEAARRGEPSLTLPAPMRAAEIAQAVFPNLTARVLALVNRWLLPAPGTGPEAYEARPGHEVRSPELTPGWRTGLVDRAADENNETRGHGTGPR